MKQKSMFQGPRAFSTRNISTDFSTPIQDFTRKGRSTIWIYQPYTSQQSTCSFMHLCKSAHNITLQSRQWQQIISKLCRWNRPKSWAITNWAPWINSTHPAPTAVRLFHLEEAVSLVSSSWKQEREAAVLTTWRKHLRKDWKVWGFFHYIRWIGNETREAGGEICSCEGKGEFIIIILNICIKHSSKAGSEWYLKPEGKSCH